MQVSSQYAYGARFNGFCFSPAVFTIAYVVFFSGSSAYMVLDAEYITECPVSAPTHYLSFLKR